MARVVSGECWFWHPCKNPYAPGRWPPGEPLLYLKGLPMRSVPPSDDSPIPINAAHLRTRARYRLLADIRKTWGKFGDDELRHLRDIQDLVSQLVLRYGMDEERARREADAVLDGRSL